MSASNTILATLMTVPAFALVIERLRLMPVQKCRLMILYLAILWLLLMLAEGIWLLVPSVSLSPFEPVHSISSSAQAKKPEGSFVSINVKTMQQWFLFGQFEQADEVVIDISVPDEADLDAKETRLSLKLLGIMQSSEPGRGHAIIQYQSQSELYVIGDAIPVSRGVSLSKVLADRVIIDNSGNFESLFLWDETTQKVIKPQANVNSEKNNKKSAKVVDHRGDDKLTKIASDYKQKLLNDPLSMAEVMRFSTSKGADGNIQGYRVSPGRDRANFKAFGLKSGDVITAVNGVDLSNQANAMRVYQDLSSASEASFDILRRGEPVSLIISLE